MTDRPSSTPPSSAPEGGLRVRACRGHFHPCWFDADGTEGGDIWLPGDPFKTREACQAAIDADARKRNDPAAVPTETPIPTPATAGTPDVCPDCGLAHRVHAWNCTRVAFATVSIVPCSIGGAPLREETPEAKPDHLSELRDFAQRAYVLLSNLTDDDECQLDHHGNCQTHHLERDCSVERGRVLLDQYAPLFDELFSLDPEDTNHAR